MLACVPKPSDTKQRILDTARELFLRQGVQKTTLQEIADQLGITKPALYYHFASREELVRSIMQLMVDDGDAFVRVQEASDEVRPRALLEGFYDFNLRHRADITLLLTETTTLAELGLMGTVHAWRERLTTLLFGPSPTLAQSTRAVLALGGIQDCVNHFVDAPEDELRAATVAAACATLGVPAA